MRKIWHLFCDMRETSSFDKLCTLDAGCTGIHRWITLYATCLSFLWLLSMCQSHFEVFPDNVVKFLLLYFERAFFRLVFIFLSRPQLSFLVRPARVFLSLVYLANQSDLTPLQVSNFFWSTVISVPQFACLSRINVAIYLIFRFERTVDNYLRFLACVHVAGYIVCA